MASPDEEWSIISSSSDLEDDQSTQNSVRSEFDEINVLSEPRNHGIDNDDSLATLQVPKFVEQNEGSGDFDRPAKGDGEPGTSDSEKINVLKTTQTASGTEQDSKFDNCETQPADDKRISDVILFYEDLNRQIKNTSTNFWSAARSKLTEQTPNANREEKLLSSNAVVQVAPAQRKERLKFVAILDANSEYLLHYLLGAGFALLTALATYYVFQQSLQSAPSVPASPYDDLREKMGKVWTTLMFQPEVSLPWYKRLWLKKPLRESKVRHYTDLATATIHKLTEAISHRIAEIPLKLIWNCFVEFPLRLLWNRVSEIPVKQMWNLIADIPVKLMWNDAVFQAKLVRNHGLEFVRSLPIDNMKNSFSSTWHQTRNEYGYVFASAKKSLAALKENLDSLAITIYRYGNALIHQVDAWLTESKLRFIV